MSSTLFVLGACLASWDQCNWSLGIWFLQHRCHRKNLTQVTAWPALGMDSLEQGDSVKSRVTADSRGTSNAVEHKGLLDAITAASSNSLGHLVHVRIIVIIIIIIIQLYHLQKMHRSPRKHCTQPLQEAPYAGQQTLFAVDNVSAKTHCLPGLLRNRKSSTKPVQRRLLVGHISLHKRACCSRSFPDNFGSRKLVAVLGSGLSTPQKSRTSSKTQNC